MEATIKEEQYPTVSHQIKPITTGEDSQKKNYCIICRKQFSTSGNLRNHTMTIHDNQRPFKCPHANCNKMYSIESRLQVHLRTHTGSKPYVCLQCDKSFNEKGNLKTHERFHSDSRPFKCTECDKTYKTNGHLKDHCEIQHKGMRKFKCSYCEKQFGRISTLKAHIRTHTGEKNFMCKIAGCIKVFAEKGNMEIHYKRHLKRMMSQPCSLPSVSSSDAMMYSFAMPMEYQKSPKEMTMMGYGIEVDDKVNAITRPNSNLTLYNVEHSKAEPCVIDSCYGSEEYNNNNTMNLNMNIGLNGMNEEFLFCDESLKNNREYLDSLTELNVDLDKAFDSNGFF